MPVFKIGLKMLLMQLETQYFGHNLDIRLAAYPV